MDITLYQFGQEEIAQLREHRDKQRDGRLKFHFIGLLMLADQYPPKQAYLNATQIEHLVGWVKTTTPAKATQSVYQGIKEQFGVT